VVMRPRKEEGLRPSLVRSSGERDGGLGVDGDGRVSMVRLPRWRWINRFIRAFLWSEDDEGEGDDGWLRARMRRSRSAFTTSDIVGDGVESREEMRIGEDGRDIVEQGCFLGGTRRRWEFEWDGGRLIYPVALP